METEKLSFIQGKALKLLEQLSPDAVPRWGKMNAQQMVEHLNDFFRVSILEIQYPLVTPEEQLPKYKAFLESDKEFRENTQAPETIVGAEPSPVLYGSLEEAIAHLNSTVEKFNSFFSNGTAVKTLHPVFGDLDFREWIRLHHKHLSHHLRQFGLIA
ncbi:MAG: hypothetical protein JWQ27_1668 [Ferruginibacter sp.]|nr:hypothetical protein [Ferruginibacter sp.]